MGDSPNMSYCMYENTLKAVRQITREDDRDTDEISESEQKARLKLFKEMREYVLEMQDELEEDEEKHLEYV